MGFDYNLDMWEKGSCRASEHEKFLNLQMIDNQYASLEPETLMVLLQHCLGKKDETSKI